MAVSNLPGVTSNIRDYGLQVTSEPTQYNDSILIIGTSSDGPMYEPIPVLNKEKTLAVFGAFGQGTLVRGVFEALDGTTEGTPDIRAMRVGNGVKSLLEIEERVSSDNRWDDVTTGHTSLKLEAIYPGSIYNAIAIFQDEEKNVNIYNPKTGNYVKFSYDATNPNNAQVDARNVRELVDAINADAEASSIVTASTEPIETSFEISVNESDSGIEVTNGKTIVTLKNILSGYTESTPGVVQPTGYIYEADTSSTAGNLIDTMTEVFSLSTSDATLLDFNGANNVKTDLTPFDGKGDDRFNTIQALDDYDGDDNYMLSPTGSVVSEYMNYLDRELILNATVATSGAGFVSQLTVPGLFNCPDDHLEPTVSGVVYSVTDRDSDSGATTSSDETPSLALAAARASSGIYIPEGYVDAAVSGVAASVTDFVKITSSGIADGFVDGTYPGQIIVEISDTGGVSDSEWSQLFYHPVSGIYIDSFTVEDGTGIVNLAIGANASGCTEDNNLVSRGLIKANTPATSGDYIVPNKELRISCNTVKGFITEAQSLPELQAAADIDWTTYFFKGNEVKFSDNPPTSIIVNYGIKINYEIGSDVLITNPRDGELTFAGSLQPGPAGLPIDETIRSTIGFKYDHLPQFPAIATTALSLDGGTNGTNLDNGVLYDELQKAYDDLENYEVQIVVPMGANVDSIKPSYNSITGLPEDVNAQFQVQLDEFLAGISTNVNEAIGIIGVESPDTTNIADINTWAKRLTEVDLSDPTRGANIMPLLDSKYLSVAAFEPVFDNLGGTPYTANGQAAYAGMIASLMPHYSPTNKSLGASRNVRFKLSNQQLSNMTDTRLVSMRTKPGRDPVITEAITAAATGSDFTNLTTVRITFAAMDVVREVCDPFIGQPNTQSKRNAMEAAITKGLQGMVEVGALRKYSFTIGSTPNQQVLGIIDIDLILVPVFEIKTVRTTVRLRTEIPQG